MPFLNSQVNIYKFWLCYLCTSRTKLFYKGVITAKVNIISTKDQL